MALKYPTTQQMAEMVREHVAQRAFSTRSHEAFGRQITPIERVIVGGMEMRHFDLAIDGGRIYRVRVSDITPDKGG